MNENLFSMDRPIEMSTCPQKLLSWCMYGCLGISSSGQVRRLQLESELATCLKTFLGIRSALLHLLVFYLGEDYNIEHEEVNCLRWSHQAVRKWWGQHMVNGTWSSVIGVLGSELVYVGKFTKRRRVGMKASLHIGESTSIPFVYHYSTRATNRSKI